MIPRARNYFCFIVLILTPAAWAEKWTLQYFFDQDGKEFHISDLAFPSASRGIAVGVVTDNEGEKGQFTALVTSDAGAHWSNVPLKEFPRSLFFLNDSVGWMVTNQGLWFTEESGRSWIRLADQIKPNKKLEAAPAGGLLQRVFFLDAKHGYAVGGQKTVLESRDGGRSWTPLAEAAKPSANPAFSFYTAIAFDRGDNGQSNRRGIIAGGYVPPKRGAFSDVPDWMQPDLALAKRTVPLMAFELDTRDGGGTWASSTAPVFGTITQIGLAGRLGLAVLSYEDAFPWPSDAQRIDLKTGKSDSVFRRVDRRVTSSLLFADGQAFLAAVEPAGRLRSVPIPGKVRILRTSNLAEARVVPETNAATFVDDWTETPVDYRAVANTVILAGPDAEHLWAATDTGMILRLTR